MQWDETGLRIPLSFGQNMLENFIYIYIYILYYIIFFDVLDKRIHHI